MRVRANLRANQTQHLTSGTVYTVIGLDHDSFRVLNDNGEPIIYAKEMFDVIDSDVPSDWVWERYTDDEYYANPPELSVRGFYEDLFDRNPKAQAIFEKYLQRIEEEKKKKGERGHR